MKIHPINSPVILSEAKDHSLDLWRSNDQRWKAWSRGLRLLRGRFAPPVLSGAEGFKMTTI